MCGFPVPRWDRPGNNRSHPIKIKDGLSCSWRSAPVSEPCTEGLERLQMAAQMGLTFAILGGAALFWQHQRQQASCNPVPAWHHLVSIAPLGTVAGTRAAVSPAEPPNDPAKARLLALAEILPGVRAVDERWELFPMNRIQKDRVRVVGEANERSCTLARGSEAWPTIRGLHGLGGAWPRAPERPFWAGVSRPGWRVMARSWAGSSNSRATGASPPRGWWWWGAGGCLCSLAAGSSPGPCAALRTE